MVLSFSEITLVLSCWLLVHESFLTPSKNFSCSLLPAGYAHFWYAWKALGL
jgi:hypothetical protein